jgi:hypothetical protein
MPLHLPRLGAQRVACPGMDDAIVLTKPVTVKEEVTSSPPSGLDYREADLCDLCNAGQRREMSVPVSEVERLDTAGLRLHGIMDRT